MFLSHAYRWWLNHETYWFPLITNTKWLIFQNNKKKLTFFSLKNTFSEKKGKYSGHEHVGFGSWYFISLIYTLTTLYYVAFSVQDTVLKYMSDVSLCIKSSFQWTFLYWYRYAQHSTKMKRGGGGGGGRQIVLKNDQLTFLNVWRDDRLTEYIQHVTLTHHVTPTYHVTQPYHVTDWLKK